MLRTALAIAALCFATSPASAQQMVAPRIITVQGEAKRHAVPDEAHIMVNLNAQALKLADAKHAHDAKLTKLMGIVKNAGIEERKVRSESSTTQPVYSYDNTKPGRNIRHLDGYRVQTTVDITVSDTAKVGDLMQTITDAGFEQGANEEWGDLLSVDYQLSNPEKLRSELLAEAIANAKAKADDMAKAAGSGLGRVYAISEGNVEMPIARPMAMNMMKVAMAPAVAPPAGEEEVNATVTVSYELKD